MAVFITTKLVSTVFLTMIFLILGHRKEAFGGRGGKPRDLVFTAEPQDATVRPGSNVKLKCKANYNKGQPQYKWVLNGSELVLEKRALLQPFSYKMSFKDGSLRIRNISYLAYGMYQCVAEVSGRGIISRRAYVRMSHLYQTSDSVPSKITCNETSFCTISHPEVSGFPTPSFIWEFRKNSSEHFAVIGNNRDCSSRFAVSLEGMLCNVNVSNTDQGEYRSRVFNEAGTLLSNVYHIKVKGSPDDKLNDQIHVMVEPRNITVGISRTASFDCIASGMNTVVKWWKGHTQNIINAGAKYEIRPSYRLSITQTVKDDEGWYGCLVVNNFNSVIKEAYLNVRERVELVIYWGSSVIIPRRGDLLLHVTAHHGEIEWYKNGRPIDRRFLASGQSVRNITREVIRVGDEIVKDEQTLMLKDVVTNDGGIYQVLGRGFENQVSDNTKVIIYGCGGIFQKEHGFVTSPRFPNFYSINVSCLWVIKNVKKDKMWMLHLSFGTFDVGDESSCRGDYLEIRDGESQYSGSPRRYSNKNKPPDIITSRLSALRLTFKSGTCTGNPGHKGFNATFWIADHLEEDDVKPTISCTSAEPTTAPTNKFYLSSTTRYETNGPRSPTGDTKTATASTTTWSKTSGLYSSTRVIKTATKTATEYRTEGKQEAINRKNNNVVYGATAAGVCLLIVFGIALFLFRRRKGSKELKDQREVPETAVKAEGGATGVMLKTLAATGVDPELETYATSGQDNIPFYCVLENNTAENLGGTAELSTEVHQAPVYDVLEATYLSAGVMFQGHDSFSHPRNKNERSENTYTTADCDRSTVNCVTPFTTSFSEEIYTTLSAQRDENNIYASLCNPNKNGETDNNQLASLPGIDSSENDYVSVTN